MATGGRVLVVDDDPAVGKVVEGLLRQDGIKAIYLRSGAEALEALAANPIDVLVTDLRMPGMDGMELLARAGAGWPDVPVVMMTAHGTVSLAVEAMKRGAADFVLKPFDCDELLFVVQKALKVAHHADAVPPETRPGGFVGESQAVRDAYQSLARAAAGTATVLLRGESGTGKELAARALHDQSPRRAGPLVTVHCAALPDALLESELFGYEKGAFTGAVARKPGRVELAEGGTLFLDEIGDITPAMQAKLLRLLQQKEFQRLGGVTTLRADVRFVTATNRDLEAMVEGGTFREDLFYRLNVVPIRLPPLRERPSDIGPLALQFCAKLAPVNNRPGAELDTAAITLLEAQPWKGNVRELENFVERLVVMSDTTAIGATDVERELARSGATASQPAANREAGDRSADRQALLDALQRAGNNRSVAARLLGVSRRTLYNRLEDNGIR